MKTTSPCAAFAALALTASDRSKSQIEGLKKHFCRLLPFVVAERLSPWAERRLAVAPISFTQIITVLL